LAYIFVADSMGQSSFKFKQCMGSKRRIFPATVCVFPFKVIQGRWFWYQSKARMRLPICPPLWLWSYLAPFPRYDDLLAKIAYLSYPSLIRRPRSLCSLWNFAVKLAMSDGAILQRRLHDRSWSYFNMIPDCDRQKDGRTDRIYYS